MKIFGYRIPFTSEPPPKEGLGTKGPPFKEVSELVKKTIDIVVTKQLGSLKPADWAKVIEKAPEEGLGLGDSWGLLTKNIIEKRLYNDPRLGRYFRVIHVTEKYIDDQKKKTLNDVHSEITMATLNGPHKAPKGIV